MSKAMKTLGKIACGGFIIVDIALIAAIGYKLFQANEIIGLMCLLIVTALVTLSVSVVICDSDSSDDE